MSKTSDSAPIRTFLAVELPGSEKAKLAALEREFAGHASVLKWVAADLLHITVRFLGSVRADRIDSVKEAALKSAAGVAPFSLAMVGLGAFPNVRLPRVIWVGLREDAGLESLQLLHRQIEAELSQRGFAPEDRRFSPHITLARTRDDASSSDRRALGDTLEQVRMKRNVSGAFEVDALVVMKSELGRSGPRYTPMERVSLGRGE